VPDDYAGCLLIAYEPVCAIGTGVTATPADASAAHAILRAALQERFGKPVRLTVTIRETTGNSARDQAAAAVSRDAFVRDLVENFDATIVESSIKPVR
jgi:triosephosphate isomerase